MDPAVQKLRKAVFWAFRHRLWGRLGTMSLGWIAVWMVGGVAGGAGVTPVPLVEPSDGWIASAWAARTPPGVRSVVRIDPVELRLAKNLPVGPDQGDGLTWQPVKANAEGWFEGPALRGGYVFTTVTSPTARVALLEAPGSALAYVNGVIKAGDPYATGALRVPVELRAGENTVLVPAGRGQLRLRLVDPPAPVFLEGFDATLPDLTPHVERPEWGAVIAVNAQATALLGTVVTTRREGGRPVSTPIGPIPAMGLRKIGFRIGDGTGSALTVELRRGREVLAKRVYPLTVRKTGEAYRRTFVSGQDGSVQYYGVRPAVSPASGQALYLSLHGASVEAIGQAEAYSGKTDGTIVAPTNRRPFGFDWEEIGRRDAQEVLAHAAAELRADPRRLYLTGHSMGGHGTWHLGAVLPGQFAALGPSAGWASFYTYVGMPRWSDRGPVGRQLDRASAMSDTHLMLENLAQQPMYVIHGDADDNVPVTEARNLRERLAPFNPVLKWHEEPGAGHWWDNGDEPGAACIDWAPMFDFFAQHRRPANGELRRVVFTTLDPGASSEKAWVAVRQQERTMVPSRVAVEADPHLRRLRGTTQNVRRIGLGVVALVPGPTVTVELDGSTLEVPWPRDSRVRLVKRLGGWRLDRDVDGADGERHPGRGAGFKEVFRNHVALVVGTAGSAEETAWGRNLARYIAETFLVRGNGSVDVIDDVETSPGALRGRNVLLLGTSTSVKGYDAWVPESPVRVSPGAVSAGGRTVPGDVAVAFLRPRPDEVRASIGVLGGSGPAGRRLVERLPLFASGAGVPEVFIWDQRMPEQGLDGVVAAGFFGPRWEWVPEEVAWRPDDPR